MASAIFLLEGVWGAMAGVGQALSEHWWLWAPGEFVAGIALVVFVSGLSFVTAWLIWRRTRIGFVLGVVLCLLSLIPIPVLTPVPPHALQTTVFQAIVFAMALTFLVIDREGLVRPVTARAGNEARDGEER